MIRNFLASFIFSAISLYLIKYGVHLLPNQGWFWCPSQASKLLYRNTQGDTVSTRYLLIFTMIPFLLTTLYGEWKRLRGAGKRDRHFVWEALEAYSRFLVAYWLNILLMVIAKFLLPEPRPHFLQTCDPEPSLLTCTQGSEEYQAYHPGMCRLSEGGGVSFTGKDVLDSLRSFPSGHAQTGFFSAIVALHYIFSSPAFSKFERLILSLFWTCNALLMSISRITDNRHHWWDVLAGCLFGALYSSLSIRFFLYRSRKYPSLKKD
uniref:Lipid phosphate phosphohydrolase 2 n=1 Tax=Caligus rogercresseyi TaxID=217165 RepID=C1BPG4_CALRO|nr:Lipid phosphate phosphohydrolase 2 [Caligus rogercresseyi]